MGFGSSSDNQTLDPLGVCAVLETEVPHVAVVASVGFILEVRTTPHTYTTRNQKAFEGTMPGPPRYATRQLLGVFCKAFGCYFRYEWVQRQALVACRFRQGERRYLAPKLLWLLEVLGS